MSSEFQKAFQQCINAACRATFGVAEVLVACPRCGELLDVAYDWSKVPVPARLSEFAKRWASRDNPLDFSGVWRFRELLDFCDDQLKVTLGEGQTILQRNDALARYVGLRPGGMHLQYEGLNPSGSFKDNGMAAAFSHARMVGAKRVACASTGNTSASLAMYAAHTGMQAIVFVGSGRDRLRQARPGAGVRRADAPDRRRLRRVHAPREGGLPVGWACIW